MCILPSCLRIPRSLFVHATLGFQVYFRLPTGDFSLFFPFTLSMICYCCFTIGRSSRYFSLRRGWSPMCRTRLHVSLSLSLCATPPQVPYLVFRSLLRTIHRPFVVLHLRPLKWRSGLLTLTYLCMRLLAIFARLTHLSEISVRISFRRSYI